MFGIFSPQTVDGSEIPANQGVSENSGFSPQIINFNRVLHYKPSIMGYHYFWNPPPVDLVNIPIIYRLLYVPGGGGFLNHQQ